MWVTEALYISEAQLFGFASCATGSLERSVADAPRALRVRPRVRGFLLTSRLGGASERASLTSRSTRTAPLPRGRRLHRRYTARGVLNELLAVRRHLDDTGPDNAPLQVVPGSHLTLADDGIRVHCEVPRAGVLAMRPLLLHASSKIRRGKRRVLHFLFVPRELPGEAE